MFAPPASLFSGTEKRIEHGCIRDHPVIEDNLPDGAACRIQYRASRAATALRAADVVAADSEKQGGQTAPGKHVHFTHSTAIRTSVGAERW